MQATRWPPVVGDYFVVDKAAPVAVSTLASVELAAALAESKPAGLGIVGKTETENIGLDKIIKNMITNPALRFLIVAGQEPAGHRTGSTLLALAEDGVDPQRRVIGSPGKRPVLRNVSFEEIEAFRRQVEVIDLINCDKLAKVTPHIEKLASRTVDVSGCCSCDDAAAAVPCSTVPTLIAGEVLEANIRLDAAGYFVIVPVAEQGIISVEHYAYDHKLLRIIEGYAARTLYRMIIDNGWVTELSHAAYLGKELTKAELSLKFGFKYIQDGA
jgi:tetrahydromethanopterin S-methyltransferase subunit A